MKKKQQSCWRGIWPVVRLEAYGPNTKATSRETLRKKKNIKEEEKEKGLAAGLWLVKSECKKFLHTSSTVKAGEALKKADKWESELQMLKKFSPEELELHIPVVPHKAVAEVSK